MVGLCLIIETPCGGDSGYRFLISPTKLGEAEIARIAAEASHTPVGQTYVSVSNRTRQKLSDSTVREGTERIVLHGIQAGMLQSAEIRAVKAALSELFAPLHILAETVDWRSSERSTVIVRPELRGWVDQPGFRKLPRITPPERPGRQVGGAGLMRERALSLRGIAWGIAVGGIVVLVVVVAILFGRRPKEDADADPVPGEPPPNTALRELARDWNCTPIELGRSLLRAANWDRREEADAIGLDAVLADGEILAILNRIEASNDTDRFLVSPAVEREGGFRRFLTGRGMETPSDVLAQRRWLFLTWQSFSELRQSGSRARSFLREIDGGDAFSRFIIMAAEIELDTGTGNGFREPTTPLFDQQDVMVYRMLGDVRHLMDDAGLTLLLMSGGDGEADLPKFVSMLEESRDTIPGALVESRRSAIDKISLEGVGVVRNDAYVDLKNFLLQLTSFARL